MYKHILTIGLNDKIEKVQIIPTDAAIETITNTLIRKYGIFAFTMTECKGVYQMDSDGTIVRENSIRVEIVEDTFTTNYKAIIAELKELLNQESIMFETIKNVNVKFI